MNTRTLIIAVLVALLGTATEDIILEEGRVRLVPSPGGYVPSADRLLSSVAHDLGCKAVGILLTGMGSDGARGLLAMREAGAYTIAQDESTCIVYGMPRAAAEINAASEVLRLEEIAPAACRHAAGAALDKSA